MTNFEKRMEEETGAIMYELGTIIKRLNAMKAEAEKEYDKADTEWAEAEKKRDAAVDTANDATFEYLCNVCEKAKDRYDFCESVLDWVDELGERIIDYI